MSKIELSNKLKIEISRKGIIIYDIENFPYINIADSKAKNNDMSLQGKYHELNQAKKHNCCVKKIKELCYNNFYDNNAVHLVLTFDAKQLCDKDLSDIEVAKKELVKFKKRMNRQYNDFWYIATFARQKNENWHFHMLCNLKKYYNIKSDVFNLWGNGRIELKHIANASHFRNTVNYLVKNMSENFKELEGKSVISYTRGLQQNIKIIIADDTHDPYTDEIMERIKNNCIRLIKNIVDNKSLGKYECDSLTGEVVPIIILKKDFSDRDIPEGFEEITSTLRLYKSYAPFEDIMIERKMAVKKAKKSK